MTLSSKWTACLAVALISLASFNSQARGGDIVDTAVKAGSFKTLAAALQAADLVDALKGGTFTVFAPTDTAFAKLPEGTVESLLKPENKQQLIDILTFHVVKGAAVPASRVVDLKGAKTLNGQQVAIKVQDGKVLVENANVVKTDISCDNGIVHVIDTVLLPATDNLPATAEKAGNFKTLLAAVQAAGLAEALSGKGPFTVFAPTDEAFAKLPEGTVETLLKPENRSKLAAILKYHVVPGRVYSSEALAAGKARTLQGNSVTIAVTGNAAQVNGATLVTTDIDASNGVIHVIDSVLLPSEKQSALTTRRLIELAVHEGVPLYNAGHTGACAEIYMTAAKQLLEMKNHGLSEATTDRLMTALRKCENVECEMTQAWTMRHALNTAYRNAR